MQSQVLLLGAHMSVSGGLEQAVFRAQALGCTAVQFFSKSNRQWKAEPLTAHEIATFKQALAQSPVRSTTIHAGYLINIGSPILATALQSRIALADEYARACALDVDYLVFHPGSHVNDGESACLDRIADQVNRILADAPNSRTRLLLETMAGQGSTVCYTFEQLAYVFDRINRRERVGICLDTCHVFAAGYDIAHHYHEVMNKFDAVIGLAHLAVIHVNDSKKELGSRVDRHEHIGQGNIGLEAFRLLMQDPRLVSVSKILETPKDTDQDDIRNLAILRELAHTKSPQELSK